MDSTEENHVHYFLGSICSSQNRKLGESGEEESQHYVWKKKLLCNSQLKETALAVKLFNI